MDGGSQTRRSAFFGGFGFSPFCLFVKHSACLQTGLAVVGLPSGLHSLPAICVATVVPCGTLALVLRTVPGLLPQAQSARTAKYPAWAGLPALSAVCVWLPRGVGFPLYTPGISAKRCSFWRMILTPLSPIPAEWACFSALTNSRDAGKRAL